MFSGGTHSKRKKSIFSANKIQSLPLHSHLKQQRNIFQTPFKTNQTTHAATLSLNSLASHPKHKPNNSVPPNRKNKTQQKRIADLTQPKKTEKKNNKKKENRKKENKKDSLVKGGKAPKANVCQERKAESLNISTNVSFYRSTRRSFSSEKSKDLMTKISKIFDLVTQGIALPYEVQILLNEPLYNLKLSQTTSRFEIAKLMLQFKNQCLSALKKVSESDLTYFLRCQLPEGSRWAQKKPSPLKDNSQLLRSRYFQSLRPKQSFVECSEERKLNELQNRLNYFVQRSLKNKKVYL